MQKVIFLDQIRTYSNCIDQSVIHYIEEECIETYECFERYNLIAFDWYDIGDSTQPPAQILIYMDREDIFYLCENQTAFDVAEKLFEPADSNEWALCWFFRNLLQGKARHLEQMEDRVSALDDSVIDGRASDDREKIVNLRYETLRLKKFYEPLETILEELCDNSNGLISENCLGYCRILRSRASHLVSGVRNLREYVAQVRESYQAQIDIEQNRLMKVFTLVTSIFLPLTLLVGWYGMNFNMPEFRWEYGYAAVIAASVAVCAVWFWIFRKRGWFK